MNNQVLIELNGKFLYVSQKPWIINDTIRNNVLLGKSFNEQLYKNCIEYSCLAKDMKILKFGDQTKIGEKGANLSGGQKVRLSLAQSLYQEADIYLFDDILR